jgi:hypothetical protein
MKAPTWSEHRVPDRCNWESLVGWLPARYCTNERKGLHCEYHNKEADEEHRRYYNLGAFPP